MTSDAHATTSCPKHWTKRAYKELNHWAVISKGALLPDSAESENGSFGTLQSARRLHHGALNEKRAPTREEKKQNTTNRMQSALN